MANELCQICEEGQLQPHTEQVSVEHLGHSSFIESRYAVCNVCNGEQTLTNDASFNKRAMNTFKKQAQGLLTGPEIKTLRKKWKINQAEAAKIFGGGPTAFSKYETDDILQSEAMDKLLRLASTTPEALGKLMSIAGVSKSDSPSWENISICQTVVPFARRNCITHRVTSQHKYDDFGAARYA